MANWVVKVNCFGIVPGHPPPRTSMDKHQAHIPDSNAPNASTTVLNAAQHRAVTFDGGHALILAGAGCGKTKTIIARCQHLISQGVPAHQIYVLTFTRRSAAEIIARVESSLGNRGKDLQASTFHTFCMAMIRRFPKAFGCKGFSVIDRDDQVDLFKAIRGRDGSAKGGNLPKATKIADIYSFARNTRCPLSVAIEKEDVNFLPSKARIADICRGYEERKRQRKYLDYDDILDVVGTRLQQDSTIRHALCSQYKHILVDEFQDTNPLQWHLLSPFLEYSNLFCVGDDAQSIYGFRGADFKNVHHFKDRVPSSTTLRLEQNYRSTQEILDVANWLLAQSSINYDKHLIAVRGSGQKPRLLNFTTDWQEAHWIATDIAERHDEGAAWNDHMILVRSAFAARPVEACLIERNIPYKFIGGTKLFQTAHVKDLLSSLRIVANPEDEIAWVRYLRLWPGIGEIKANTIVERVLGKTSFEDALEAIGDDSASSQSASTTLRKIFTVPEGPAEAVRVAVRLLSAILEENYKSDWDRRARDFPLVEKLAQTHTSILSFIEQYLLDPVSGSVILQDSNDDVVTLITVHSAKGTESKVCYAINVSPGAYPSSRSLISKDEIEEERRVLYVALTRAKNELIISRRVLSTFGYVAGGGENGEIEAADAYFLNNIPENLADLEILLPPFQDRRPLTQDFASTSGVLPPVGIVFD
jgi:DNA helicase II / ATP-dependent DNA helicase PcrA